MSCHPSGPYFLFYTKLKDLLVASARRSIDALQQTRHTRSLGGPIV